VGRLAIFRADPREEGRETFWGFSTAVISLSDLLEAARISSLTDAGYAYRLLDGAREGAPPRAFHAAGEVRAPAVAFPIQVPGGSWTLEVAPAGGWPTSPLLPATYAVVLLGAAAAALLTLSVLRRPAVLAREVAARTADLGRAYAALALTQQVVDRAALGIAWLDGELRIAYANEAFARLCGRAQAALAGVPLAEAGLGLGPETTAAVVRELEERRELVRDATLGAGTAARQVRVVLERLRVDGRPLVAVFVRDVTEQRTAEEQVRQAQKLEAIGQLAGGVAHDFNNLLTAVVGNAALLAELSPPGSEGREAADTISAAARRGAELTRQLLGFARRNPVRAEPFDAHGVAREVVRLLSRTLDKRIVLAERLGAPRATVRGDPGQLQQALLNLAVNARDAMPEGGEIAVESAVVELGPRFCDAHPGARPGPHLALSVSDQGHGIPPDLLPRIFEPFFTTKGPGAGTGMGLAIVYGVARDHGGAVDVESAPGQGARFTLYLPLATEPPPAAREADAPPRRGKGLVLVVDDDELPRRTAARALAAFGYEVAAASGASEALALVRAAPVKPAAVLTDLAMPGADGAALCRELRALAPGVPVVVTSGHGRDARIDEALAAGATAFLAKPWEPAGLAAAIGEAIAAASRRG
jgi:PAS domain S-box-containing protein